MEKSTEEKLKFSQHARVRQTQRNITDSSVGVAMQRGEQADCKDTTIYFDQNVKVIFNNDSNTVISVNKNTRNTKFELSERTKEKEQSLLRKANVKNNDHAMCELADLYLEGELGEKNIKKAYDLFKRAAKMGNSHAMCKISALYENGDLGAPNQELADAWMQKAADRNNVYALAVIGQDLLVKYKKKYPAYPAGSDILKDSEPEREKILYYLNKSADKGSTRAMWQLGNIYEEGLLGEQNVSKAIELYVKAAKLGSPTSLSSLHSMTLKISFSAEELEEILDNVSSLLTTTSIGMAFEIGQKQLMGNLGRNPVRGLKMIEQVAVKQYDQAMHTLAKCYCEGTACDVNLKLAQYWFTKLCKLYDESAKSGNVNSLWKLGKLYLNGNVGNIDLSKAESCFKQAIERSSDPDWIYDLGKLYLKGRLGDKPIDIGMQLIAKAITIWKFQAAQGNTKVYDCLGNAYFFLNSHKNAAYWLSKAPLSDTYSQLCLAKIYFENSSSGISLGLEVLESVILYYGINPSFAFDFVNFTINEQTVCWLQDIANNIKKRIPSKNQQLFESFAIATLAKLYERGQLGEIDYTLASKYYYKLFINFESIVAGNKLVWLYSSQYLPEEYYDAAKNWAVKIPALVETNKISFREFVDCVLLLGNMYQNCSVFSFDIKEATKWLYLASYFHSDDNLHKINDINRDLANLPQLDYDQKEQIISELSKTTQSTKILSPLTYKVLSRIMGEIFYDSKIINQNIDKATYWYTESALANNRLASFALGKIYQNKENIDASIRWYKLSAQQGNINAIKELTNIFNAQNLESLSPFLNRYQHQSLVKESEIRNINPLKNLEFYPKTVQEMYELGKHYLKPENNQYINVLNAAFWFRKAIKKGNIEAAIELHSMYKQGILGSNLISVADNLYLDTLNMCCSKLKREMLSQKQNTSYIVSLVSSTSSVLKAGNITFFSTLNKNIEKMLSQTQNIDYAILRDVLSDLELLKLELSSNN